MSEEINNGTYELDSFRHAVREWLAHAQPPRAEADRSRPLDSDAEHRDVARAREVQRSLFDAGLAGLTWPTEYGGRGLGHEFERAFREEVVEFDLGQQYFMIAIGTLGPTVLQLGTEAQKQLILPAIMRGEATWCQLFSEPGAGSDVASLQTKAIDAGDHWIVTGQKVWTSGAHRATHGALLARTDPDVPKHGGISMLLVDMSAPGVEVVPLRQATGEAHFNEVFFDEVRVPKQQVLGAVNDGWRSTTTMLMNERVAIGTMRSGMSRGSTYTDRLVDLVAAVGARENPAIRQRLAEIYTREQVLRYLSMRVQASQRSGQVPGPEASVAKLANSELSRRAPEVAMSVLGAASQAWPSEQEDGDLWARQMMSMFVLSIGGGTSEIQRNILGERVLGLPREPQVDREMPYRDLLVGTQRTS